MPEDDLCILGVDIGSSKIAVSLWRGDRQKLAASRFATRDGGFEPNFEEIERLARDLLGERSVDAIGVSAGGPVDPQRGLLLDIPNRSGWKDAPLVERLESAFGARTAVENDANACALAEWRHGAGRGATNLAFLTFSTGIGAGLVLGGQLYRGHRFLAGEVGHTVVVPGGARCGCGKRGCLEAHASGAGIARELAQRRLDDPTWPHTARELVERAAGEARCRDLLEQVARHLAAGVANLQFVLDLEVIVLGTIAVGAGELLLEPLRAEARALLWPSLWRDLRIVPAALGEELGDVAAFTVALERISAP